MVTSRSLDDPVRCNLSIAESSFSMPSALVILGKQQLGSNTLHIRCSSRIDAVLEGVLNKGFVTFNHLAARESRMILHARGTTTRGRHFGVHVLCGNGFGDSQVSRRESRATQQQGPVRRWTVLKLEDL